MLLGEQMNKVHISLNVSDVKKSQEFYETFLDMPAHKIRPGYCNFDVNNPPLKLAMQESGALALGKEKVSHLGIQVPSVDDVENAIERLQNAGFNLKEEKDEVCCYAKQDKVWISDPDGNRWEVYTVTDEMETEEKSSCSTSIEQTSCC
jgi:catechol 2,3-dioxygenase-like lactoylglutathione lyase family enzyme